MAETAVATRKNFVGAKSSTIASVLDGYADQVGKALPKGAGDLNAQRIIQIAATIIAGNSKLAECDAGSVVAAVMQSAILGLNPLPQLAECYFVPYKSRVKDEKGVWGDGPVLCTFQAGYRGWINLYHRCRLVREVYAAVVREGDEFEYEIGLERKLRHKPVSDVAKGDDGKNVTHAYAVVHYTNGGSNFVVLTKAQLQQLRARGSDGPAWKSSYEAMAKAKALKQLRGVMPSDGSIDGAYAADERVFRAEALTTDGSGVNLAALEAVEIATTTEIKAPSFMEKSPSTATGDDTAEQITNDGAIAAVNALGATLFADEWPVTREDLCKKQTQGAENALERLSPAELSAVKAELDTVAAGRGGKK